MKYSLRVGILSVVSILSLMTPIISHAFPVAADAFISPNIVQARTCNLTFNRAIACRSSAVGVLPNGAHVQAWANLILVPGACDYAYVYAAYPYYFVGGYGVSECVFY